MEETKFVYSEDRSEVTVWLLYRGADKSLARPGRKQGNVSVRMA